MEHHGEVGKGMYMNSASTLVHSVASEMMDKCLRDILGKSHTNVEMHAYHLLVLHMWKCTSIISVGSVAYMWKYTSISW
jgi:hypothetical protein